MEKIFNDMEAEVIGLTPLDDYVFALSLAPLGEAAPSFEAGQFALVRFLGTTDPLLGRPFAIVDATPDKLTFLIGKYGRGTTMMGALPISSKLGVRMPLGKPIEEVSGDVWLLAGGAGAAPLIPASKKFKQIKGFILGVESASSARLVKWIIEHSGEVPFYLSSDDGTLPGSFKGNAVELLSGEVKTGDTVICCGTPGMTHAAVKLSHEKKFRLLTGGENRMACGWGGCHGCKVEGASGASLHACTDGTFFDAADLKWDFN